MSRFSKLVAGIAFLAMGHTLFAYNGGYENSLLSSTTIDGKVYPGYGNNTVVKRTESGTTIAANAYAQCQKLASVDLVNVTSIGNAAFAYSALTSVELPATLKSIGYIPFGGCKSLASVTINSTAFMTSADENKEPFRDCTALKTVTAKCAPPTWDFKKIFPSVTTVKVPKANLAAWQAKKYSGVTVEEIASASYTIKFVKNDGSTVARSESYPVSGEKRLLYRWNDLEWTVSGKVFCGWGVKTTDTTFTYCDGQSVTGLRAAGNTLTLYAIWRKPTEVYTIKFVKNDGSKDAISQGYSVADEQRLLYRWNNLQWTVSGKVFCGWGLNSSDTTFKYSDGQPVKGLRAAGNTLTLYAIWRKPSEVYTIKFVKNDGTNTAISQGYSVADEQRLLYRWNNLQWTVSGKVFCGWGLNSSDTTFKYSDGQPVKGLRAAGNTLTLYAIWRKPTEVYTIKFVKNDGTNTAISQGYSVADEQRLLYRWNNLQWTVSGKIFCGWGTSASASAFVYCDGQLVKGLRAAGNTLTLYAIWKDASGVFTVRFNKNDGTTTAISQGYVYGVKSNLLKRWNHLGWALPTGCNKFLGWALTKNGPVKYADNNEIAKLTSPGTTINLYAVWQKASAQISASKSVNVTVATVDGGVTAKADCLASGYYTGVLNDASGCFELLVDVGGDAYFRILTTDGAFESDAEVFMGEDGTEIVLTEDLGSWIIFAGDKGLVADMMR